MDEDDEQVLVKVEEIILFDVDIYSDEGEEETEIFKGFEVEDIVYFNKLP